MVRASVVSIGRLLGMANALLLVTTAAVEAQELRNLNNQFKTEAGCPVNVISAKTVLEIDPIGTPMACRIYIDYKNISAKALSGVKFRIGYIDGEEKVRGTFHAPDGHVLQPGSQASAKWRGEKVDPRTQSIMIRALVAKFSDGTSWESEKIKSLAPGTGGDGPSMAGTAEGMGSSPSPLGSEEKASAGARPASANTGAKTDPSRGAATEDSFESEAERSPQTPEPGRSADSPKSSSSSGSGTGTNPQSPAAQEPPVREPEESGNKSDGY